MNLEEKMSCEKKPNERITKKTKNTFENEAKKLQKEIKYRDIDFGGVKEWCESSDEDPIDEAPVAEKLISEKQTATCSSSLSKHNLQAPEINYDIWQPPNLPPPKELQFESLNATLAKVSKDNQTKSHLKQNHNFNFN